jgi:hypothetical protein
MTNAVFISRGRFAFSSPIPNDALRTVVGRALVGADVWYGGPNRITGTTKNKGIPNGTPNVPVRVRVRLHYQLTGYVVREMWSHAQTGAFTFNGIKAGIYYLTSFDHTQFYNGEIATDQVSEPMP